jgi:hypothetical protein
MVRCVEDGQPFPAVVSGIRLTSGLYPAIDYTVMLEDGGEVDGYTDEWLSEANDSVEPTRGLKKDHE